MIGKRLSQRYKILKLIGGGGMADVYLAHDIILDRDVAVKVLKNQFSQDNDFIRRFRREAEAASSLSHPNVVNIYDVGEEDNLYYIVMEYVDGPTLKQYINEQDGLKVDVAVRIMKDLSSAIAHAHLNRIIHRDIKPHNILIGPDGTPKITDFGIARAISEATITHTNSILGSVHYLSPEQARGGHVTYKSDIYSLGIVLYEMLAGQVPFNGDTAVSIAIKHLQTPLPSIRKVKPHIPQSVENAIIKATAKDPIDRYATASDMESDLNTVLSASRVNESTYVIGGLNEAQTEAIPIVTPPDKSDKQEETMIAGTPLVQAKALESKKDPSVKKKGGWKKWLTAMIIIFVLLLGSVFVAFTWLPQWLHVDEVTIPDHLEGMEADEAAEQLIDMDLRVQIDEFPHDEVPEGSVISHYPRAGTSVKVDTLVTLRVSEGAAEVPMDDVIGMSLPEAEQVLGDYREVEVQTRVDDTVEDETILEQWPEAGQQVIMNETTVRLIVSEKPVMVMRNLIGYSREEVMAYISEESLLSATFEERYSDSVSEGTVISHDPSRGTEIDEITRVTVIFSLGPEPQAEEDEGELEGSQEEEPLEEEQVPIEQEVPLTIEFPEDLEEPLSVRIERLDSTTDEATVVVEEEVEESTTFLIPMVLDDEDEIGYVFLYYNGEEQDSSPMAYTYEDLLEIENNGQ
ncbi:Stk1 family PASTA domain-containing Ser/Thr kinase [Alteribacter aurantiacus]|uniref:Stk1 family PASTA domain-containing Ser/Thr kinase n=1 Tax=Alteribacter aurantiacus TaxID=254410 RepID=UPI0004219839|nr:Stk1 family PASTA domain-containing Ser/Thr kinase [Alteribacter aurantiacus]